MGLLDWLRGRTQVQGTARVESIAEADGAGRHRVVLTASAPGLPSRRLVHEGKLPRGRVLAPGATLPVTLDRDDPARFRVVWDAAVPGPVAGPSVAAEPGPVVTSRVVTLDGATVDPATVPGLEKLFTALGADALEGGATSTFTETVVTVNGARVDPSQAAGLQEAIAARQAGDPEPLRRIVEQLARAAGGAASPPGAAARLAQLEELRAAGLVTPAEYAEKRKRILDEL